VASKKRSVARTWTSRTALAMANDIGTGIGLGVFQRSWITVPIRRGIEANTDIIASSVGAFDRSGRAVVERRITTSTLVWHRACAFAFKWSI
jgi:hypothetical protein